MAYLRWLKIAVMGLCALGAAPRIAAAQKVRLKRARFHQVGSLVTVSVGFREMFDRRIIKRLRSGFATTVVMRVYLYGREGGTPLSVSARRLQVAWDLWDRRFYLTLVEPHRKVRRRIRGRQRVVDLLTSLWRFPIAPVTAFSSDGQYFVAVVAEVNPISPEVLSAVRRWLRKPYRRRAVGGESLFGSFVSIFVNDKIRRAEKTFKVRSNLFYLPR